MYKSLQKRYFIIIGILTLLTGLLIAAWIFIFFHIQSQSEEVASLSAQKALAEKKIERARNLSRLSKDVLEVGSGLDKYFLKKEDAVDFLNRIEDLAEHAGVTVEPAGLSEGAEGLDMAIKATGSYGSLMYFTRLIESIPYYISANSITLESEKVDPNSKTKSTNWNESLSITVKSYIAKPKEK